MMMSSRTAIWTSGGMSLLLTLSEYSRVVGPSDVLRSSRSTCSVSVKLSAALSRLARDCSSSSVRSGLGRKANSMLPNPGTNSGSRRMGASAYTISLSTRASQSTLPTNSLRWSNNSFICSVSSPPPTAMSKKSIASSWKRASLIACSTLNELSLTKSIEGSCWKCIIE